MRRPRRGSPDFGVVDAVMMWWLGDEWELSSSAEKQCHLRSLTNWQNQRFKRVRHHLVDDDDLLQSRLTLLLRMTSNGFAVARQVLAHFEYGSDLLPPGASPYDAAASLAVSYFRGTVDDVDARVRTSRNSSSVLPSHYRDRPRNCDRIPVNILSLQGATSLGYVVFRGRCCCMSGNLLCDIHAGTGGGGYATASRTHAGYPEFEYPLVLHDGHYDYVVDGHLTHPVSYDEYGREIWVVCGKIIEFDRETAYDAYDTLCC